MYNEKRAPVLRLIDTLHLEASVAVCPELGLYFFASAPRIADQGVHIPEYREIAFPIPWSFT